MKNVKFLVVIVLILSIVSLALTFILYTTRQNEKEARMIAEEENNRLIEINASLTTKNDDLKLQNGELAKKNTDVTKKYDQLSSRVSSVESEKLKAIEKLTQAQTELEKARKEFADYKVKTADIVNDFKTQNEQLLAKVEELKGNIVTGAGAGVSTVASAVPAGELPKVVVTAKSSIEGKVIVVNRKYKFFICNLGSKDNIALRDSVVVYRNNTVVASATVEKIYDSLAACGIVKENDGMSIQEGDIVKVSK